MNIYDEAKKYRSIGWNVIPLKNYSKNPASANSSWKLLEDRMSTDKEFEQMFTQEGLTGLGLVTGKISGIYVLDEDSYKEGGKTISTLSPLLAESVNGGRHHYRKYNPEFAQLGYKKGIYVEGKGQGGFIVLPPSQVYKKDGNTIGNYKWIKVCPVKDIPILTEVDLLGLGEDKNKFGEKFDRNSAVGVNHGERHNTHLKLANSLWNDIVNGKITQENGWLIFVGANNSSYPPESDRDIEILWRDAETYIKKSLNNQNQKHVYSDTKVSFLSFNPKLIKDLTLENAKVEWLWQGFIARGHLTLFSALWKAGKSTLVSQLLKAIQNGKYFAGQVTNLSKALILSEESETMWARRRDDLNLELESWIVSRPIKKRLNSDEWIKLLKISADFCENNKVDLLVVDTLSGFWNVTDENNASLVSSALLPINELLEKNIAVLLIHHFRKSGGSEGIATRGSGALGSYADILIEFSRLNGENPNDTQRQLRTFSRFEETPTEVVIEMVDGEYITRGTKAEVSKEARIKKVLVILNDNEDFGLTTKEIFENWDTEEFGSRPTKRTIRNYIDLLLHDGRVNQVGEKIVGKTKAPVYSVAGKNEGKINLSNAGKQVQQDINFEASNERKETLKSEEIEEMFGGKMV